MIFLKLGGSLITDKTEVEAVRWAVLRRIAEEIGDSIASHPSLRLLLGNGSGSFGHVVAARYGTRNGVTTAAQWRGFAEVSTAAASLNAIVRAALQDAGLATVSFGAHSSADCVDGKITSLATKPIQSALNANLIPLLYGDVAFDSVRGGTIVSTEEIMSYLAADLQPRWLLLAGETDGVYDLDGVTIPTISRTNLDEIRAALGGSRGTDVTGGMVTKVLSMLDLVDAHPNMSIRIFSGLHAGAVRDALIDPESVAGTTIFSRLK